MPVEGRRVTDPEYGRGQNWFDPAVRAHFRKGATTISGNPGARDWTPSDNPEAEFSWPVVFNKDGAFLQAPEGSRWRNITAEMFHRHSEKFGPECVKETAEQMGVTLSAGTVTADEPKPYRRRRS